MGWRDDRNTFKSYYTSEEYYSNPYAAQIDSASSSDAFYDARLAYIAWEAEQLQYQQQLSDSIALRNSDRAYNSPSEQIRRLRSAGINPDIQSSSGGSGSSVSAGSSQAPSVPSLSTSQFLSHQTPQPTAADWMQTAGAFINQVGTFATQVVGLVDQVGSMSSALSMRRSQAESASLQTHRDRMLAVGELAQGLPVGEDLTEEQIDSYLDDLLVEDKSLRSGLKHYVKTPSYQAAVNEALMRQRKTQSWLQSMPLESLNDFHEAQKRADIARVESEQILAEFYREVNAWEYRRFEQQPNGDSILYDIQPDYDSAQRLGLSNRADRENQVQQQQRARSLYKQHLQNLRDIVVDIDDEIAALQAYPDTVDRNALIAAKKMERMQIMAIGNESLSSLYDYGMRSIKRSYDSLAAAGDNMDVSIMEQTLSEHKFSYSDRVFMTDIVKDEKSLDRVLGILDKIWDIGSNFIPGGKTYKAIKATSNMVTP